MEEGLAALMAGRRVWTLSPEIEMPRGLVLTLKE